MGKPLLEGTTLASRQRQAFNLLARGKSTKQVAAIMGLTEQTIRTYVDERKAELQGTIEQINRTDYVALVLSRFEQLRSEAWQEYEKASKAIDRARWWRNIMDLEKRELDTMQDLGLISKTPQKHQHSHTILGEVNFTQAEKSQMDAMAVTMLAQSMGVTPEEAQRMCGRPSVRTIGRGPRNGSPPNALPEPVDVEPVLDQDG